MRSLPVELDEETVEALEMERRLIGFDSRSAYVRWIVEHRASITEEPDGSERILEAYRDRIADLERRLAAATDRAGPDERFARSEPSGSEAARDEGSARDGESGLETGATKAATSAPASADESVVDAANPGGEGPAADESGTSADADDGWTRSERYPSIEFRGSPRTTVSRDRPVDARSNSDSTDSKPDADGDGTEADAGGLAPERVVRIPEDPVSEDADVLENVEVDRLDELSRRAVAKTRSRLNRPVETGLEYRSSTTLSDEAVRPGADVVDLDSLSVPGRSDAEIDARREVAGHAIAFLRDEGRARKSDFVDALYERHPAGYETVEGWWSCLKRVLKQVDAVDGGDGRRVWRYTG